MKRLARRAAILIGLTLWATSALPGKAVAQQQRDANPQLEDPIAAFANIPPDARQVQFRKGTSRFLRGGHFQGIQSFFDRESNKQICFLTRDSDTKAYFLAVEFDPGPQGVGTIRHFQELPSDGKQPPLKHPGGTQLIGDYLVVGVEDNQDKRRSQVQFWDVSNPCAPVVRGPLTIRRQSNVPKDRTAGAVGIVKRATDHLLVVGNWDSRVLDFYTSNGLPLSDDRCRFSLQVRWSAAGAVRARWHPNRAWGNYQGLNLVSDPGFKVYLLGFHTNNLRHDVIDLFSVDLSQASSDIIQKAMSKRLHLRGGTHFQYSGGIFVKSSRELVSYSTGRDVHEEMTISVSQ